MRHPSSQHPDRDGGLLHVVVQLAQLRTSTSNLGSADKDLFGMFVSIPPNPEFSETVYYFANERDGDGKPDRRSQVLRTRSTQTANGANGDVLQPLRVPVRHSVHDPTVIVLPGNKQANRIKVSNELSIVLRVRAYFPP